MLCGIDAGMVGGGISTLGVAAWGVRTGVHVGMVGGGISTLRIVAWGVSTGVHVGDGVRI